MCKLKCPLKGKIFLWLALYNKVLTWDNLQKRRRNEPGRHPLCFCCDESVHHLFLKCGYVGQVWKVMEILTGQKMFWRGDRVEEALEIWITNQDTDGVKALPVIVLLGVWLARNSAIFEERFITPFLSATQSFNILKSFPRKKIVKAPRQIIEEVIDRSGSWLYFDGATQGNPLVCGAGGIIYISESHTVKFRAGLGHGTNNFAEIMVLKLALILAAEKRTSHLQVSGDSMLVIKWLTGEYQMDNFLLQPILDEINALNKYLFTYVSCQHVYRERNKIANELYKEGLQLATEQWVLIEEMNGLFQESEHTPCL
jgi:ribonuclease HI